jgi:metal-responsive CopG/Arc/MetJ family transcriptional regulator
MVSTGLSIPKELCERIDRERGDVPRSVYIRRLIERGISRDPEGQNEGGS